MADVSVRPARPDDAAEIGRIQVDTWRAAYRQLLPAGVLDELSPEDAAGAWRAAITEPPSPRHHVLIALEQDWRVGFVALGPADDLETDDPEPATTVALAPILVEPRWGRRGHGSRLLAAAVDHARSDGMTRAIAWVPEGDAASREFLISAGWAPDGLARALDTGAGELREIRLHASLLEATGGGPTVTFEP
jgi:GNAT superfamily N-acetyltransferase